MEELVKLTECLSVEDMQKFVVENNENYKDEIMLVVEAMLSALCDRMPEAKFIAFCEEL